AAFHSLLSPPLPGELVLTHFARTPFVCFGTVRVGCSKSQVLPIANPQDVPVQVVIDKFPSAKGFTANESRFVVEHDLVISWIPLNAGGVRETVTFSVGCVKIKAVFLGKAEDPPKKKRSLWDTIKRNKSSEGPVKSKKSTIMNTIASKTTISQIDTVKTGGHRNPLQSRENLSLAEDRVSPLFHPIHVLDNKGHEVKPLSPISTVSPVKQEFENCAPQSFKRSVTYSVLKTDDDMSLPVEGEPNSDGRYNVQCSAETFINEPNLVHSFKISQQILDSQTYCFPHLSGPLTPFSQRRILSPDSFVKGSYFPEGDSEPRIVAKILSPDQFLKESLAVVNVSSLHSSQEEARSLPAQSSLNPSDFQSELIQERNDESISPVHSDFPVINVRDMIKLVDDQYCSSAHSLFCNSLVSKCLKSSIAAQGKTGKLMPGVAQSKLTFVKLTNSVIPRHPMPFAAKNMFFDERWKEKQERGFTWWLNFILTPDDFTVSTETSRVNAAAVFLGSESHSHKMSVPAAPTKEEMSLRSYTAKRRLNRLRRSACRLFTSEGMVKVIQKLEGAIAVKHLLVRKDRHLWKDYGERMKVLKWLLSYNTLWLRIGLETIYGELIPLENNSDVIGLGRFILNRLLWNSDVVAEYRHPTVPHLYRNEHKEVLAQFTLKKFLLLVWFLDCAKQSRLIDHDPCLFCKDAEFKSSKDLLLAFSRDFLSGEGDLCRHLSYMGLTVSHFQTPLHEFNFAITNLAVDLRCGVRIVRAVELLTQDWTFSKHLRVPTISRLQKLHNVEIALKALRLRGIDLKAEDDHVIDSRDVVDGHRERTLALLWRIIFAFQVEILLNVDHLNEEIKFLKTTLRNQQRLTALQSMSVPPGPVKDHSPVVASKDYRLQVKLLMDWVNAVCAYHGVKVENFTVPFSDGRVLCYLVHHYHPGLLAADAICQRTTQTVEFAQRGSVAIDTLSSDSDESSIDISSTTADLQLLENEKKNFHLVTTAVVELGGVPAMIRHLDMSNTIPDEKVVIAYLSFLCARLLDLRKETRAARLIQAAWRKYKVSRELQILQVRNQAACVIQAAVCRFLYRQHFKKKTNATIIIQAHWQGYVARRKAKQLRMTKVQAVQNAAATVIQTHWRGYSSRRQYQNLLHCCILMQKHIRRKIAVTSYRQMLRATVGLQRCFRAHLLGSSQRREYLKLKLSAIVIQAAFRKWSACKLEATIKASIILQKYIRGFLCRKQYKKYQKSITLIQAFARGFLVRAKMSSRKNAAIIIQKYMNAYLAGKQDYVSYHRLKWAAIVFQAAYRGLKVRNTYRQIKSAIVIQSLFRMHLQRKKFVAIQKAAVTVQSSVRMKLVRIWFLKYRQAAITVQRHYRTKEQGRKERRRYVQLRQATITIQAAFNRWQTQKWIRKNQSVIAIQSWYRMCREKRSYLHQRRSCIRVQSWYRCCRAKQTFLIVKRSALFIQEYYRAYHRGKAQVEKYQSIRQGTITIQAYFRGMKARRLVRKVKAAYIIQSYWQTRKERLVYLHRRQCVIMLQAHAQSEYKAMRFAAIVLQSNYRGRLARRQLSLLRSVVKIQSAYRAYVVRRRFSQIKKAAIIIQRCYRANKLCSQKHKEYIRKKEACICLQSAVRQYLIKKQMRLWRQAAIRIQSKFRMHRQRRQYLRIYCAAVIIQRGYLAYSQGFCQRQKFLRIREAAICLQAAYKGYMVRKIIKLHCKAAITLQAAFRRRALRIKYQAMQNASIAIQRWYRTCKVGQQQRAEYRKIRSGTILLQALYRGFSTRKKIKVQHEAAKTIQTAFRRFRAQKQFAMLKDAVLTIQQYFKAKLAGDKQRQVYLRLCQSAAVLQAAYKGMLVRKEIKRKRQASIVIQSYFRMHQMCTKFKSLKSATLVIQDRFRAYLQGKRQRQRYQKMKNAAVLLQAAFHAMKARKKMKEVQKAASIIQTAFRSYNTRKRYLSLQAASTLLQRKFRALLLAKQQRKHYLCIQGAVLTIQSAYRGMKTRQEILHMHWAATVIQSTFRMHKVYIPYQATRLAAIIIQVHYRAHVESKAERENYLKIRHSVVVLQAALRGMNVRKHLSCMHKSATVIQASYRMQRQRYWYKRLYWAAVVIQQQYRACKIRDACVQQYTNVRNAVICIQTAFHSMKTRQEIQRLEQAIIVIQGRFRAYNERKKYLALKDAATTIQQQYRGLLLARIQRQQYLSVRNAAICFQATYRGKRMRQAVRSMHLAAIVIQSTFRMHQVYVSYQATRLAAIIIQVRYRAHVEGKTERENYLKIRHSVVVLQAALRGMNVRKHLSCMHKSAILIQSFYRMHRQLYLYKRLCWAAVVIQQRYRACKVRDIQSAHLIQSFLQMCVARKLFLHQKSSAIILQATFRGYRARVHYRTVRNAAVSIQHWYRACKMGQSQLIEFQAMKRAAISIQAVYKGVIARRWYKQKRAAVKIQSVLCMMMHRKRFLQIKSAAISIQSQYHAYKARKLYKSYKGAAVILQRHFKSHLMRKEQRLAYLTMQQKIIFLQSAIRGFIVRRNYEKLQKSTKKIQVRLMQKAACQIQHEYRGYKERKKFLGQKLAVLAIQRLFRAWQLEKNEKLKHEKRTRAAVILQAVWRGLRVRKEVYDQSFPRIIAIRCRIQQATEKSSEEQKLGNRTAIALNYILKYKHFSWILAALQHLEVATRLSSLCCENFAKSGATPIIFTLIRSCNRSVPSMDIIKYAIQVLLNVSKYEKTSGVVYEVKNSITILIDLLQMYREKAGDKTADKCGSIFTKVCCLLSILSQDSQKALEVRSMPRAQDRIHTIYKLTLRKHKMDTDREIKQRLNDPLSGSFFIPATPVRTKVVSRLKPDWVLRRDNMKEIVDPLKAIQLVMDTLGISTNL
uniref:Assembly factor for spindle microtubules n=1 Tax=Callorhinchus milii TaxID=7868 RepID=A0A4W3K566_CALMI